MHGHRRVAITDALLLLFFLTYFYRLGAANVEALIYYPFWRDMGPLMSNAAFIELRTDHLWKIYPLMVAPIGLLVLVTASLAWLGASPVPRWAFVGSLFFQLVAVVSTVLVQLPIQMQLSTTGFDPNAIDRLISSDLLFRKLPSLVEGGFVVTALWMVIASARRRTGNLPEA